MKKIIHKLFLSLVLLLLFYILIGWKIPILWHMETLKLPKGCKTVYHSKIWISDVYWLHTKGEKVIKCDMGYELTKTFIEEHNSPKVLEYINIYPYEGMSDIDIYDSQYDEMFWQQPDRENYIKISYFKKW